MKKSILLLAVLTAIGCSAKEIYVDYSKGNRSGTGDKNSPFDCIETAFKKVAAGDTIYILPQDKPIRGFISIEKDLGGTPEAPITIDGMNNIFTGEVPLKKREWKEVSPGLFCRKFSSQPNNLLRLFLIHDGKAVRMGRFTKGDGAAPFKALDDLQPGEWTIIDPNPAEKKSKADSYDYEFYVKLGEGEKTLADGKWSEPKYMCGVKMNGRCSKKCPQGCAEPHIANIIVKNLIVTHYWNDGYNFHFNVGNIKIENCAAVECGDDGISAHNNVQMDAKNFVSIRNSSGICHIGNAKCTHENFYIEDSLGTDFNPQGSAVHILNDIYIKSSCLRSIVITSKKGGAAIMKNCFAVSTGETPSRFIITRKEAELKFENVVLGNYKIVNPADGVTESDDIDALKAKIAAKRAELFALFGGNLEKACGEK